ncbi:TIGR02710 family CRISPR-associated CARF protein [Methylocaldum szegediense]|uniref:TIGR02710 family CRISPR-associated protein n=1 Tax=Methylocaldum szegediense TaxID=73780 RepID=A0ABM9HYK1_9GAMM|nr:TIGR02710 family CRISPR-associated CARF protein [Methylocaldum szegediense]CAI8771703.1 TIGR02710 family CRISPR-associated protein [Methylocaldum szegediense]
MPQPILLVCTVGGSHQPIVSAIEILKPDFVCFICTGRDPGTGRPGSEIQITGKDFCIKANFNDERPSLPNIPTQTGLDADRYEVRLCPADDLDAVFRVCYEALRELRTSDAEARVIADYTGGTKTMSAGLVAAALEVDGVELQLVTGNRADLIKVHDGWQSVGEASADELKLTRRMSPYLAAWTRYAYDEAALGLASLPRPRGSLAARLDRARVLSQAYAAWDRFEHGEALAKLQLYAAALPDELKSHIGVLLRLCGKEGDVKNEPARLLDLYRNAERRAAQGRYDDAVARIYRLLEWTAQWLLRRDFGVDTSAVPEDFVPPGLELSRTRDGKLQAGLFAAWELVGTKLDSEAAHFIREERESLRHHVHARNNSILAHGFTPIGREHWQALHDWLSERFLPMLLAESRKSGIRCLPPQLPSVYPFDLS